MHAELLDRSLTCTPTPKRPSRPVGLTTIQTMLANPYYKGDVVYQNTVYDGIHPPLVDPEIWYKVQTVIDSHDKARNHTRKHSHYLVGAVFCKTCQSRMLLNNAKSKTGDIYPYLVCGGRHSNRTDCDRPAVPLDHVAAQLEQHYRDITIPDHVVTALRSMLTAEFDKLYADAKKTHDKHQGEKNQLLAKRKKLLDAHFAGAVPVDLLKEEQDQIARRLAWLDSQITAGKDVYDNARAHLQDVLDLCGDAHALYMSIDDPLRRICNQAFFERIWITDDDTIHTDPNPGFAVALHPGIQQKAIRADTDAAREDSELARCPKGKEGADEHREEHTEGQANGTDAEPFDVRGWTYPELVERTGLEPVAYGLQSRRSTS